MKAFFYLFCDKFFFLNKYTYMRKQWVEKRINDKDYARQGTITKEIKYVTKVENLTIEKMCKENINLIEI